MKNWNKKIGLALLSFGLLALSPSAASAQGGCYNDACCNPCNNYCSGVKVGADFLWWQPAFEHIDYAVSSESVTNGCDTYHSRHFKSLDPDWQPGVRVWLSKPDCWCNWEFYASYEWIEANHNHTSHGLLYSPHSEAGGFTRARGKHNLTYQTFDALISYPIEFCQCQQLSPFFGLTGLFVEQKFHTNFDNPTDDVTPPCDLNAYYTKWKSDFWSVGFRFGTGYNFSICDGFKLIAEGSGALVAGESDSKHHFTHEYGCGTCTENRDIYNYKQSGNIHIIPGFHFAIGFEYDTCYCDWEIGARIGWEFVQWIHLPNERRVLTEDSGFSTPHNLRNIGWQGLFAGLSVKF